MPTSRISHLLRLALLAAMCGLLVCGQVTFSRDWNAGKRSEEPRCASESKVADALCSALTAYLRGITACQMKSLLQYQDEDTDHIQRLFEDVHRGK